jgi:hypothetical protein
MKELGSASLAFFILPIPSLTNFKKEGVIMAITIFKWINFKFLYNNCWFLDVIISTNKWLAFK